MLLGAALLRVRLVRAHEDVEPHARLGVVAVEEAVVHLVGTDGELEPDAEVVHLDVVRRVVDHVDERVEDEGEHQSTDVHAKEVRRQHNAVVDDGQADDLLERVLVAGVHVTALRELLAVVVLVDERVERFPVHEAVGRRVDGVVEQDEENGRHERVVHVEPRRVAGRARHLLGHRVVGHAGEVPVPAVGDVRIVDRQVHQLEHEDHLDEGVDEQVHVVDRVQLVLRLVVEEGLGVAAAQHLAVIQAAPHEVLNDLGEGTKKKKGKKKMATGASQRKERKWVDRGQRAGE